MSYDNTTHKGVTIESVSENQTLEEHSTAVENAKALIDDIDENEDFKDSKLKKIDAIWTHQSGSITVKLENLSIYSLNSDWKVMSVSRSSFRMERV